MISHIEKVSRGDEALSDEFQGGFCIVRSGSIYHKSRVAFRITCEPKNYCQCFKTCDRLPAKGLSDAASSLA